MTKHEFLQALEGGLSNASPEERAAALQYYTEYLDEAGPEHEADVLAELGSPEKIAADILTASGGQAEGDWAPPHPPPPLGEALKTAGESLLQAGGELFHRVKGEFAGEDGHEKPPAPGEAAPEGQGQPLPPAPGQPYNQRNSAIAKTILAVLIAIFLIPFLGGVVGLFTGGIGVLGGLFLCLAVLFFCPFILGIGLLAGGVLSIVLGALMTPLAPGSGLLNIGLGVLLAGLGLMACYGGVRLLGGTLPRIARRFAGLIGAAVGAIVRLTRKIWSKNAREEEDNG